MPSYKSIFITWVFCGILIVGLVPFANGQSGSLTYSTTSDLSDSDYNGDNFNISGQTTSPRCVQISPDGTRVFVVSNSPSNNVLQYNLSTPHDITTASYSGNQLNVNAQESAPQGISFSKDGTYMYLVGDENNAQPVVYALSTPFEISTASYNASNNMQHLTLSNSGGSGVAIRNNGNRIFVSLNNEVIHQYNLSSAYDLTSASDPGISIDVTSIDSDISTLESVVFNNDGSAFFFTERTEDRIRRVSLSSIFNLGSFSSSGSREVADQDNGPRGVTVSGDGTRLYMVGTDQSPSRIYQYELTNEVFKESSANDGSVDGELIINLVGDQFVNNTTTVENNLTINNLPAGLGFDVAFSNGRTTLTVTLTGNATLNDDVHSVSDLQLNFSNGAFVNLNTSSIDNSTNFNTGLSLDFIGPPIFTSGNTASGPENSTSEVLDIQANNGDGGNNDSNVNYSITGGADASFFAINSGNGRLSFATARDFENPEDNGSNNTYVVQVTATDDSGLTTSQTITVTVTDVNEDPVIISANSASYTENGTGVALDIQANDGDGGGNDANVNYSITGGTDQSLFTINTGNGRLFFVTPPDFENPTDSDFDNDYVVEVTATDAVSAATVSQTITVTVTNDTGEALPTQPPGVTNMYFDGVDDRILVPVSTDFDVGDEVTYSMWVKIDSESSGAAILFRKVGGGTDDKRIHINGSGTVRFYLFSLGVDVDFTTTDQIPLNEWTHIACTYERNATAKIYFNGVEVASAITSNDAVGNSTLGSFGISSPNFFEGQMDEFKIFNTAHTQTQIQSDMASTNSAESDLLVYWNFDDDQTAGNQTTVEDVVNGNNGSFDGAPLWVTRVTNTLDDTNPGSLRYALTQANTDTDQDYIDFSISGTGVQTITPTSALPTISQSVVLNGYTQQDASRNNSSVGNDAVLNIELDGASAGSVNGLNVSAASEIEGLIIHGFANAGIALNANGSTVTGVKLGEDASGNSSPNTTAIQIIGSNSIIGGLAVAESNVIVNNTTGVALNSGTTSIDNSIRGNSFSGNTIGIDLGTTGTDTNDADDDDDGNNNLQNFPVLSSAVINGSNLEIDFSVDATIGNSDYDLLIDLYKSDGARQGQEYLTTITYPSTSAQNTLLSTLALGTVVRGDHIVATATDASGNTSEFSEEIFVIQIANFTIDAISNVSIDENLAYTSVTPSLSGDTPIGTLTYSLSGTDASDFTINTSTGVVSMVARNFESPADDNADNVYELTITATDSDGNADTESWTVTVDDVIESATFTIDAIADANVNENSVYTSVTPNISGATPIGTLTYTLGGADAADFTINSASGVVSMIARNFETPEDGDTDNVYEVTITATDSDGNADTESWTVTVDDLAESAAFTIDAIADVNVDENNTYTSVTPSLSGATPVGTLTYTLSGADATDFTINSASGVVSMVARNFENPQDSDTDNVYELTITATDSDGNADTESWTVTIDDVIESATFTIDAIADANVDENAIYTSVTPSITGTPIGTLTYTLSGADASDFTINSSTGVVSMIGRNFENPEDANTDNVYEVTITATDSDGNSDAESWTVTVDDVIESATFTIDAIADANINENASYTSVTPNITGTPIGTVTYTLGGSDASDFTINSSTGVVSMIARDFESPDDDDTDNVYEITITATDSDGNTDAESWTVSVDDVIESATFTIDAISDANVNENNTYISVTPSLSGSTPIGTLTYTLSGADASDFTINSSTGVVSMIARNFENPEDADTDNVYELTITATDSDGNTDAESWTVTVDDVIESATFTIDAIADANVNENATYTSVTPSITGSPIGTVTYTLGGSDASDFTINNSTGVVSMVARNFENPEDADTDNVYELTITATDSDGNTDAESWTVTVDDVIESATFTIDAIADANVDENATYISVTPSITGSPIGTVTYILGGSDASDFTINSSTGVVSMVARNFENPEDADTDNVYELTITATDSDGNTDAESWTVTVDDVIESATFTIDAIADANVNENATYISVTPSITGSLIGTVTYILGGSDASDFTINSSTGVVSMVARNFENPEDADTDNVYELTITATDSDGNTDAESWTVTVDDVIESATFTIDAIADANVDENATYISVTPSITGSLIGTVTYILGGSDASDFTINSSTGVVSMVARNFENPEDADTDNVYELTITATDSDGNTDAESWTVTVDDVIESATFTIDAIADANVNENATYTSVTPSITGSPIGTVTYILGGSDASDFTINSSTGVVSMVARNFENPEDADTDNVYELTITATDSDGNTDAESWTVTVDDVIESATFTIDAIADANVNENATYTSVTPSITGSPIGTLTYTLSGADASDFTIDSSTGVVSMVARNFENPEDDDTDNVYELTITATDSDGNPDTESWTVTVDDVIESATFTIDAIADANVDENATYTSVTPSITGSPIGTVTYTLSGADASDFTIDSSTGVVSMVARNFENPEDDDTDNVYELTITATDSDGNPDTESWTVTVDDVIESATFTIDAIADANVDENATYTSVTPSITGSPIGTVTYTLSGADASDFTIDSSTGVVSMLARDFENPEDDDTDNIYEVTITATDSDGNSDAESWTVTVDDVIESATFTINAIADANVDENGTYTSVTPSITGSPIGTLTYTLSGADASDFTIDSSTGEVSMVARNFENPEDDDTDNIYEVTITTTDSDGNSDAESWTVTVDDVIESATFTINAIADANVDENGTYTSVTPSITGSPIGTLTYTLSGADASDFTIDSSTGEVSMVARNFENPEDDDTDNVYELTITATDSDGNPDTESWTVAVDDVIESATYTIDAIADVNVDENATYTSVTPSISGSPIGTVTYTLSGSDASDFTIDNSTGVVSMVARNFESPEDADIDNIYELTITATDSDGNSDTESWTVTVDDVIESATFTIDAIADANVDENATYTSVTPSITGSPIGTLTYTLSGADASDFTIDSSTGVISMVARNFENPEDDDTDNIYEVTITATDSDGNSDAESWTVTVDDVIESATFTIDAITDANIDENATYTSVTPSITGSPIGTVTYTLSGSDASEFTIDSSTGVISMVARNFENPEDDDTDNIYEVTITATDSDGNSDAESWTVTVDDVIESATFTIDAITDANIDENATYTSVTPSITGSPIGTVTYALSGSDASDFTIDSSTGVISMVARNFENPEDDDTDNIYEVTITATDSDGNSDAESWTVTVDDVIESATFTIDAITDANIDENATYTSVTPSITGSPIGTVTYALSGSDASDFTIDSSTGVISMVARNFENPEDDDTDNIYEVTITATDSDGNSDAESWTVTVDDVIESATFTIDAITDANIDENATYTSVTPSITGSPIGTVTYTLSGSDASEFTIDSSTGVISMVARNFENPEDDDTDNIYEVTITATDSDGNSDAESWTVTVDDVIESATFTIDAITDANIDENATYTSVTPSITGSPIGTVTYTLSGSDASEFTIDSSTGVVSMVARDFENPEDDNSDNVYELMITATDGDGNEAIEAWTVNINNLDDEDGDGDVEIIVVDDDANNITITPSNAEDVDVGVTTLNVEKETTFEIRNTGQIPIEILQIILSDNNFEVTNFPPLIEANESFEITIVLLATQTGIFSSTVEIITSIGSISFAVMGEVIDLPKIEVKNVVTPNGDGKHDFLRIENIEFYPDNKVEIFNRTGKKVFSIDNYNNTDRVFDGTANTRSSLELISGNYYYTVQQGKNKLGTGFLLLRR